MDHSVDMTADTNHSSMPILSLLPEPYHKLFPNSQSQNRAFSFHPKLLLHLSCNKNGISGSFTFHKSRLHIICVNLLLNSVFEDPFHHFHSMFNNLIPL